MTPRRISLLCAVGCLAAGCMVGPDYKRPELAVPPVYRGAEGGMPPAAGATSYGDLDWSGVFPDPDLQALIRTALEQNYDLRIAVSRILQAQSQVTIARSKEFPTVDGNASAPYLGYKGSRPARHVSRQHLPSSGRVRCRLGAGFLGQAPSGHGGCAGRPARHLRRPLRGHGDACHAGRRRLSDSPRAGPHAGNFPAHRELPRPVRRPRASAAGRRRGRRARSAAGRDAALWRDAQRSRTSSARSSNRRTSSASCSDRILARSSAGVHSTSRSAAPRRAPGLPLDSSTRRPDIRQAEQQLVAANAQIGVATALLYPQVTISGFAGAGGATLNGSNFGPFGIFSALPAVTLPVFNMGRLRADVDYNDAVAQEAGLRYQQTLQQALREVSDALVAVRKRQEFRQQQELLVKALADASEVANMRYEGGVSSYPRSPGYGA